MRIITVSGARSGVGKTTLALLLIRKLPGYAAIKVTISDLFTSVTDDPATISEEGKDTALMKSAGADPVVWVQCPPSELMDSLTYAFNLAGNAAGVLIEGNSPVRLIKPSLSFFVTGADISEVKPDAADVLAKADVVVVNVEQETPPDGFEAVLRAHNRGAVLTTMGWLKKAGEDFWITVRGEKR